MVMKRNRTSAVRGFTLVELMITIAIAAILLVVAIPDFTTTIRRNRASTQTNALVAAIGLARSEAIKRGIPVSVCASANQAACSGNNNWATGWIVFTDSNQDGVIDGNDQPIQVWGALSGNSAFTGPVAFLTYQPSGLISNGGSSVFNLTPSGCTTAGGTITLNAVGQAQAVSVNCQ